MSRWAKSEEELKWRVVICMCWHKMARLRPFPLNADASGRAHRLNWWCTTSWMRGNKSTSRLLVSLLLAPGNCGQFNWKQLGRIQRASRYHKIQVNLKQVYFCSLQRSSQDFWWLIENLQLHWKLTETYEEMTVNLGSLFFEPSDHIYTAAAGRQLRRSSSNPSFVDRGVNPSLVEILCPTTTLFLITILAEVLWSWGNKYSPLGCLEHTLDLLLSLLNKIPWLENPMLWNRFQPSSL